LIDQVGDALPTAALVLQIAANLAPGRYRFLDALR